MTWIVTSIIMGLIILGFLWTARKISQSEKGGNYRSWDDGPPSSAPRYVAVFLVILWGLFTFFSSFHRVEYGHVGIVKTLGSISTIRVQDGPTLIFPWQDWETENVQTQSLLSETDCYEGRIRECYETASIESTDVFVVGVLNFHIDPQTVRTLRENVGPNYIEKVIHPRINQVLKDETRKYRAVEIIPRREEIRNAVRDRLTRELAEDGIAVEDFLLKNVSFKDDLSAAIDQKTIANQEAEAATARQQVAIAEAERVKQEAIGRANVLREEAQGQAEANKLINESLTPLLIQFQALQKLADNIQIALIPSGQGIILDPAELLKTPPTTR